MQINFYTNKENFLELFEWIKAKFKNLKFFDDRSMSWFDEKKLHSKNVGDIGMIYLTDENSELAERIRNNTLDFSQEKYPYIHQIGIELALGYSDDKIYDFDFSTYNPYAKDSNEPFYRCRFYLNTYYMSQNVFYKSILQKIANKIRRNSIHIDGLYVGDYLYTGKHK